MLPVVLTIAGSDCSGGAGIQADLKTIAAHGLYGESVICALTAQNTTGVQAILPVPPSFVQAQMDSVFDDIVPDAVKVGMVGSEEVVTAIAERLDRFGAGLIVVDPVMAATSGSSLAEDGTVAALVERLFPLAALVTPNLPEAQVLAEAPIHDAETMELAARRIKALTRGAVLLKGGHLADRADDLLLDEEGRAHWFTGELLATSNTHGTGCTLSSAIACGLAEGLSLIDAVGQAKRYVTSALAHDPHLGKGSGPLDHLWALR